MSGVHRRQWRGVTVLHLEGEVGREDAAGVERALGEALGSARGPVLLDLRRAAHLHYRVARLMVGAVQSGRLRLVGPTPYVRQLLRLAGALEADTVEHRSLGEAWRVAAA